MARLSRKRVTILRAALGWIMLACLIPLFVLALIRSGEEVGQMKSLGQVLDEKVELSKIDLVQNSYIYDRDEDLISEVVNDENRMIVPFEDIPDAVKNIFLTSEDQNFYEHRGIDFNGIARAALANLKKGEIDQGGSTITQQLSRNLYLNHERTYNRKLTELLYSYQLEKELSKDEILYYYLNTIFFNHGVYGIGSAAEYYFNKPLKSLTLAEMAFICAIPNNPSLYDPLKHFDHTKDRQIRLLDGLKKAGKISDKELKSAAAEDIKLSIKEKKNVFPDYVTYVNDEFKELVAEKEGYNKRINKAKPEEKKAIEEELNKRISTVLKSGVKIYTAMDPYMQKRVTERVNSMLPYQDIQGAAVVINHQTHQITALSGGKDYQKFDFNRAYQAFRQPGSSIKPLLDYGPYIEETGATTNSLIDARKFCSNEYCPNNYNEKTYGTVSLRTAFKYSYNTPAVRILDRIGVKTGFSYLEPYHFQELHKEDYRLPSALGGLTVGVSPLEMTDAYTTFANDGSYTKSHAIKKVTDLKGKVLYEWKDKPQQIFSKITNDQMRKLLTAVVKEGTGRKANFSSPYIGGKTGTSNDYHDIWFIGLTDQYSMGVWVGKDQLGNVESIYKSGPHLSIWRQTMNISY
ncbi:transglycosylase domain-containing protein [Bacillus gobiensis]|uniref:transglycosylase domain-containing protein n=1 Tax=Bacillus gobiensis TaxID=1441095 RepID=UPI003D1D6B68